MIEVGRYFSPETGEHTPQSVLIVDDEPMARTLLRLMLVRAGFNVRPKMAQMLCLKLKKTGRTLFC